MREEREALIRYRLERAAETMAEAKLLARGDHWNGCVNRLYYACFYGVTALLLRNNLGSSKHSGVRGQFNLQFVKTGLVSPDLAELYNNLYQSRNRGDYEDLVRMDEATVRPWLEEAPRFLTEIGKLAATPASTDQ